MTGQATDRTLPPDLNEQDSKSARSFANFSQRQRAVLTYFTRFIFTIDFVLFGYIEKS